jgi:hypothetical protein
MLIISVTCFARSRHKTRMHLPCELVNQMQNLQIKHSSSGLDSEYYHLVIYARQHHRTAINMAISMVP